MARARAMLVLLTAARAFSSHAAAVSASPAAAAALSASPAAAAALSASPAAAASTAVLGTAVAPVGVVGAGGRGRRPFRFLGYSALATFAAAGIIFANAPDELPDLDDEEAADDLDAILKQYRKDRDAEKWIMGMFGRGASSAQIRALTRMLRRVDRRTKEYVVAKKRKHKDEHEELWELLQELEKKATLLKSAYKLLNDFRIFALSAATWLVFLVDKYADGTTYFVCPYSGYSDVVSIFLFTVKPKAETPQGNGTGTSRAPPRMTNVSSFAWLGEPYMDVNTNLEEAYVMSKWDNSSSWVKKHTEATLVKELEEADLKSKLETSSSWGKRSSWGKKLILVKRSSWGKNLFIQKRTPSLTE